MTAFKEYNYFILRSYFSDRVLSERWSVGFALIPPLTLDFLPG